MRIPEDIASINNKKVKFVLPSVCYSTDSLYQKGARGQLKRTPFRSWALPPILHRLISRAYIVALVTQCSFEAAEDDRDGTFDQKIHVGTSGPFSA